MNSSQELYAQHLDEQLAATFDIREPARAASPTEDDVPPAAETTGRRAWAAAERAVTALLSVGILSCLGGFFLYVPALSAMTVAVLLCGMLAMFWIGLHVGERRVKC